MQSLPHAEYDINKHMAIIWTCCVTHTYWSRPWALARTIHQTTIRRRKLNSICANNATICLYHITLYWTRHHKLYTILSNCGKINRHTHTVECASLIDCAFVSVYSLIDKTHTHSRGEAKYWIGALANNNQHARRTDLGVFNWLQRIRHGSLLRD